MKHMVRGFVCLALVAGVAYTASAETYTWVGGTGNWENPANWTVGGDTPERAPGSQDDVTLPAPDDATKNYVVTANEAIDVASLTVGSDTIEEDGCLATFESKTNGMHQIGGDLVVKAGGKMTHTALPTNANAPADERYKLNLEVGGNVTVMSNGTIDVTSCGYGNGKGPGFVPTDGDIMNYGAHGGTHKAGYTYGSLCSPTNCGSGCGNAGGGAVFIKALSGTITVDGSVVSSSTDVNGGYGAGAGGSIWLISQRLSGSGAGTISVNGGYQLNGSSGCGGRISICLADAAGFSGWHGTISARGGDSKSGFKAGRGAPGTIYLQSAGDGAKSAVTIIDNGNLSVNRDSFVELNAANESEVIGSLIVTNKGGLVVSPGESITVYGSIDTRDARTASWSDGTVCMRGSACSTISGSNKFGDFTCTEPGKTILFGTAANDNFEIATGHKLTLKGDEGTTLDLRPADETLSWKMKVNSDVETEIYYVSVSNSNAKAGEFVTAYGSKDLGGNVSWIFTDIIDPGETITWTGAADSDWMNPGNWDRKRKVVETDVAVIRSVIDEVPVTTMPVLDKGKVLVNEIHIENGATLTLKGYDLTVTNKLAVAGTLTALGNEKIFCSKDVDFAGGTFVAGRSSLVLEGTDAQQVNPNGQTFSAITIEKETGSVTFADGFKTEYLNVHSTDALTLVFAEGKTVDAARLVLRGERSGGGQAIVLRSSSEGTPWRIKSGAAQFITGVDVKDSDASAGEWARTDFTSNDSHNNTHWDFGAGGVTNAQWIGTSSSGGFSVAENWSTGKVPDENTRVLICAGDGETKTVTASEPIFVHDLILQGERTGVATFESATKETHRIAGDLVINIGGKMTHTALPASANVPADECYKLNLDVGGNVTVAEGGSIDVTSRGYASGKGPGYFNDTVQQCTYAAHGGAHYAGHSYGSLCAPTNCGSCSSGVAGGGAVRLVVDGVLRNDGMIVSSADTVTSGYGGGAGGSIWITCTDILGTGRISADGGYSNGGGSGCGGRVAVWTKDGDLRPEVLEKISACGGGSSSCYRIGAGAPGTVYLQAIGGDVTTATTIVDNNNLKVNTTVHEGSFVELNAANASDVIGTIVIRNKAGVKVSPNTSVKLYGDWRTLTGGTVEIADDAVLRLMGTNVTTIAGSQTIDGFVCSDKEKPLRVRDGAVLKLAANSRIGDVDLATDDVTLNVGTNILTVCTYVHKDGKGWADELDKLVVKEPDPDTGKTGDIVWKPQGFAIIVR